MEGAAGIAYFAWCVERQASGGKKFESMTYRVRASRLKCVVTAYDREQQSSMLPSAFHIPSVLGAGMLEFVNLCTLCGGRDLQHLGSDVGNHHAHCTSFVTTIVVCLPRATY